MFVTKPKKTIELTSGFGEKSSLAILVPAPGLEPKFFDGNKNHIFHDIHLSKGEKSQAEIYSTRSKIRIEKVLNSFGFKKELFLQNPLDN